VSAQVSAPPPLVVVVPAPLPMPSAAEPPPAPPAPELEAPAEVRVGEFLAFTLRTRVGEQHANERAAQANKALKDAFEAATPDAVHVERSGGIVVYVARHRLHS
jgi:hypothetical protein